MYLVLLVFGAVLTIAGIVLGTSGISIHDHAFDASLVTPGVVATAGGLILIGLGFALRVLQRIELALATARPMPRATRLGETALSTEASAEPGRISLPPKRENRSQPAAPAAPPTPAELAEAKSPQGSRLKFPTLARLDSALDVQETEASLLPGASGRVDEAVGEIHRGRAARSSNGTGSAKIAPRLDMDARPSPAAERPKGSAFDALWPKTPRSARAAQSPSVPVAAPSPVDLAPGNESPLDAPVTPALDEAPVSVLKSGVVDGMAYTLFSDGSIEAELPQGTIRFGSITELRNHIEQSPPGAVLS